MTDLTPEQLVERLRRLADEPVGHDDGYAYSVPAKNLVAYSEAMESAATLIEQQADQIAALTAEKEQAYWNGFHKADMEAESEAAALRKAIDEAPHDRYCGLERAQQRTTYCNCWKSKALGVAE